MKTESQYKELDQLTKQILDKLLSVQFPGVEQLREQLKDLKAKVIDEDGSLQLCVDSRSAGKLAQVIETVPVEASYCDSSPPGNIKPGDELGRIMVRMLLHVKDGKMHELEIYKTDGTKILRTPQVDELYVDTNGTPWSWTMEQQK